jgi:exonuclease SbcC
VEAVAWVLFDLLEYKKEDFVRRGEKKGSVNVTFESGLDEREYTVFRDTGSAYHVIDPRLGLRIADKKEEVFRFLWQHLGLEPGTDLRSLFRQAIGVPQGTLTSIFLEGAVERKTAFDRLLKVEEYRQAAEKLRETSRFLEQSVGRARESIARSEGILSRCDEIEAEHKASLSEAEQIGTEVEENQRRQAELRERVAKFDAIEKKVISLRTEFDRLTSKAENSMHAIERLRNDVAAAENALSQVESVRSAADQHVDVVGKLKELDRERTERDRLRSELSKVENAIVHVEADRKRLVDDLASVQQSHGELVKMEPLIKIQEDLKSQLELVRNKAADARSALARIGVIDNQLARLRESYKTTQARIQDINDFMRDAGDLERWETRHSELLRHLAEMRATLDRDERFQSEIKNGLCPVLSQKCLNLADGQTLQGFITSQFGEVKGHIAELESERKTVESSLQLARTAVQHVSTLDQYKTRLTEIAEDGARLREERAIAEKLSGELPEIESAIHEIELKLKVLGDPRSRVLAIRKQIEGEQIIRERLSDTESNLERLNSERNILTEQMEPYSSLDESWAAISAQRDSTADAYRILLANESVALALSERREALEKAKAEHEGVESELVNSQKALSEAQAGYDSETHDAERAALRELENTYHAAKARLGAAEKRIQKLAIELGNFAETRRSLHHDLKEKDRLETTDEATAFIRDTLKEAAPRVARNYVYHVSLEANRLFREISGNAEQTLKWTEDYSVSLEEDGYDRPFISLSGGEQTAAALAIRLGLLKQLTDIRIAFFDEPTANMDADRRENLGQQISRITHFDQLIVISHDDTFDSYVDNVIALG